MTAVNPIHSGTAERKSGARDMGRYKRKMTIGRPARHHLPNPVKRIVWPVVFFLFFISGAGKAPAADIALMEASALHQSLPSWAILDARPEKEWQAGHIPGAGSFSWENYTRTDEKGIRYRVLPPQELAAALGKMGIDENTPVAVYGDADSSWGGEGWVCWVLAWLGHKGPVRVVNGGIAAWRSQGLPVTMEKNARSGDAPVYHYQIQNPVNITADDIRGNPPRFQLVDTRSTREWIMGRLPGATHIPWEKFYAGENRQPVTRALLSKYGVDPDRPVVYYCTGGIRSGYAWLVHHLAGLPEAVNFEGGTEEWEKR
jgi:thiosulfate/3-mercaptopyruvate sulfurtransferase